MAEVEEMTAGRKWTIAFTVMFGTFMAVMDISVVNVSLPHMMGTFNEDISTITWVATGYAIAQIITATMAGWWSTLLGRKRLYLISLGIFIVGSILAGTARTFNQMLVYRVIQGMGGGGLVPVALSIMREAFPARQQGMAMAIYGMGVVLAPAVGPILGGWLTDEYGWPWIFYINVPISVPAAILAMAFIQDPPYLKRGIRKIDWPGIILLSVALTSMQTVMERGQQEDWFESHWIVAGTAITVAGLIALVAWELHVKEPVINMRLFRNAALAAGSSIGLIFGVALMGTTFILPQFTQTLLGYPAFQSGMVLVPRALSLFVLMPVAGWLFRFLDARLMVLIGIGMLFWSYHDLARLSLDVGYWNLVPMLVILGAGMPFMFVTLTATSLSTIRPQDMTDASSLYTLTRLVGGNIGYALTATLVADFGQIHRADLVKNISGLNIAFQTFHGGAVSGLVRQGFDPVGAQNAANAVANALVNRQAAMLAYNDTSWWMGAMFLVLVPLLLLLPGKPRAGRPVVAAG